MANEQIWNCEKPVAELLDIDVPAWIESGIAASTVASIVQSGCNSGAYMPACYYHQALRTMSDYGDGVLQYIDDCLGELPSPDRGESWGGMACLYLSTAVELWAGDILCQLESLEIEDGE
jgi:hypothetical protein